MDSVAESKKNTQKRRGARRGNGEGSIFQRKRADGTTYETAYWCAGVSLPNGKRKDLYGKTRGEVAKKLQATLHARDHGTPVTGPR